MRNRIILSLSILLLINSCQTADFGLSTPEPTALPTSTPIPVPPTEEVSGEAIDPAISSAKYEGFFQEVDRSGAVGIAIGDANAPVTLVEYADFSCPHCFNMYPVIGQLIDEYASEGKLRVVLKPISFVNPPYSVPAAQAALCAAEQSRGWEMVDQIWDVGANIGPNAYTQSIFEERIGVLGLDVDIFTDCFTSPDTEADIVAVGDEAVALGINGVPAVLINRKSIPLTEDMYDALAEEIEVQLGE